MLRFSANMVELALITPFAILKPKPQTKLKVTSYVISISYKLKCRAIQKRKISKSENSLRWVKHKHGGKSQKGRRPKTQTPNPAQRLYNKQRPARPAAASK